MDARDWDERYAAADLVWSATPNQWVAEICAPLAPGCALDVAAGEGRNAIWLCEQGWRVVAADFSPVAVERADRLAAERLGPSAGAWAAVVSDATGPAPACPHGAREPGRGGDCTAYDLVLLSYLQLPEPRWLEALAHGVAAAAPGGLVVVIVHARVNLERGWGGPQDPAVLHDPADVVRQVGSLPGDLSVSVVEARLRTRVVEADGGRHEALDTVVVLRRV